MQQAINHGGDSTALICTGTRSGRSCAVISTPGGPSPVFYAWSGEVDDEPDTHVSPDGGPLIVFAGAGFGSRVDGALSEPFARALRYAVRTGLKPELLRFDSEGTAVRVSWPIEELAGWIVSATGSNWFGYNPAERQVKLKTPAGTENFDSFTSAIAWCQARGFGPEELSELKIRSGSHWTDAELVSVRVEAG